MLNKDENLPQKETVELDPRLTRQFDHSVWSAIGRKLEPLGKWSARMASLLLVWMVVKVYGMVASIPKMQERMDKLEAGQKSMIAQFEGIPQRVVMLEKDRDNIISAQIRGENLQTKILTDLAELRGFVGGTNRANPTPKDPK